MRRSPGAAQRMTRLAVVCLVATLVGCGVVSVDEAPARVTVIRIEQPGVGAGSFRGTEVFTSALRAEASLRQRQVTVSEIVATTATLDQELAKAVGQRPDVLVAFTAPVAVAAQKAIGDAGIPLVFGPGNDPVALGLTDSLDRPGVNRTGVSFMPSAKALELLVGATGAQEVTVVNWAGDDQSEASLAQAREAAVNLQVTLDVRNITSQQEFEALPAKLPKGTKACLIAAAIALANNTSIAEQMTKSGIGVARSQAILAASTGILVTVSLSTDDLARAMARAAGAILSGTPAAEIPVTSAELETAVNLKTAQQAGVSVPDTVLNQVDQVYR